MSDRKNISLRALFRNKTVPDHEEYFEFRSMFLGVLMLMGTIGSLLFLLLAASGINQLPDLALQMLGIYALVSLSGFCILRKKRKLYYILSPLYGSASLMMITITQVIVPEDPLRILWFCVSVPAYYLLLGRVAGVGITLVSIIIITITDSHSIAPYSSNSITTGVAAMLYISTFFFIYSERTLSFFTRMVRSNEQLRHLASHDALTGVLNATTYYEIVNRMIRLARREKQPYAVFFVDLDHFKHINDTYGHESGDHVLIVIAQTIRAAVRASDIVARVGGEEFSVFLPNTGREGALLLAEKLRATIENSLPLVQQKPLRVTASIGVAMGEGHYESVAQIQRDADQAMYAAKKQGRNRVYCN